MVPSIHQRILTVISLKWHYESYNYIATTLLIFFIPTLEYESQELHRALTDTFEILYFLYLEDNILTVIEKHLQEYERVFLDQLISSEKAKLNKAAKHVADYKRSRLSYDPKEYNEDDAPVYECAPHALQTQ